ncbi:MAG: saccharopine dehydrogenase family protein [Thermoanaerobaculales bacterium]
MRVVVLGAGRVGQAIARDLVKEENLEVTVTDVSERALDRLAKVPDLRTVRADLARAGEVTRVVAGFDLAVGAVPGPMGFSNLGRLIEAGIDIVDISFFEEDPWPLHRLALERGLAVVMDCGVAPGCSNLLLGRAEASWDRVDRFSCYVGGLPVARHWPYEYRAVFSPIDVIAEYTRPARLVEGGKVVTRPALTAVEALDFAGVGTLEAFNTDGLRTLLKTSKVPEMKEKTMRYPGHCERMRMLSDSGFFSEDPVRVGEAQVRPIDLTAELLIPAWQLEEGEEDLTVMRVELDGVQDGKAVRVRYDLLDRYDRESDITSMARTTGYTCTAMVRAMAAGMYVEPGLSPPEIVGRDEACFDFIMEHLAERGVCFRETITEV